MSLLSKAGAGAIWAGYRLAGRLATPLVRRALLRRRARGKEHATRWPERLGHPSAARPPGRLVWVHAASVGEAISSLVLIEAIGSTWPGWRVLLTTGTVTSAALVGERQLGRRELGAVIHQFVPVDLPGAVGRFLDHWRPDLALRLESDLWPHMLGELARRDVSTILINARMSPGSHRRWLRARWLIGDLLGGIRLVMAQSRGDADRFTSLGAAHVTALGNLKLDAQELPADPAEVAALQNALDGRPVWLAASTHEGEEAIVAATHHRLAAKHPGLVTIVVPRHPVRGPDVATAIAADGLRSRGDPVPASGGLYVADTLGELGLWYRVAPLGLIGGTLVPIGGHNPLEATRLGCAVILGPHFVNFAEIVEDLRMAGGVVVLAEVAALDRMVDRLLSDPERAATIAQHGRDHTIAAVGVLDRVVACLAPWFSAGGPR